MSLSSGFKETKHPCRAWIQQKGDHFVRYDKDLKKDVICDMTEFFVLDYGIFRVGGFSKDYDKGILSNEVRKVTDHLTVYLFLPNGKKIILAEGSYTDIKEKVKGLGGKYTLSLYIAINPKKCGIDSDEKLVIGNIAVNGGTFEGWVDWFNALSKPELAKKAVCVTGYTPKKYGTTNYFAPIFELGRQKTKEEYQLTLDCDTILQDYLGEYFKLSGDVLTDVNDAHRQSQAGEENQEIPEDGPPPAENLEDWREKKLQDGRTLNDVPLKEMREILETVESSGTVKPTNKMLIALKEGIDFKAKQEQSKPKPKNAFISDDDEPTEPNFFEEQNDDDDIPF